MFEFKKKVTEDICDRMGGQGWIKTHTVFSSYCKDAHKHFLPIELIVTNQNDEQFICCCEQIVLSRKNLEKIYL